MSRYWFGLTLSAAGALLIASLGIAASGDDIGYGLIGLVLVAIYAGVPLLILLGVTWIYYIRRDGGTMPGRVHMLLWLPSLAALAVYPVIGGFKQSQQADFEWDNPPVPEVHVNLTGQHLWIDTSGTSGTSLPMIASEPTRFLSFWRYPSPETLASFPYDGSRLKETTTTLMRALGDVRGDLQPTPLVPHGPLAYPDLGNLPEALGEKRGNERSRYAFLYYHFPDRVEVTASLRQLSGMESLELAGKQQPAVEIVLANLGLPPIVRLEINGQSIDFGTYALKPADGCRNFGIYALGYAILKFDAPLRLRWQTIAQPGHWVEAASPVPEFSSTADLSGVVNIPAVLLYFTPDNRVHAERFEKVDLPDGKLGVRATGRPASLTIDPPCGTAADRYNPETVLRLKS